MSVADDFRQAFQAALAEESEPTQIEMVVTCAYHKRVLEPAAGDQDTGNESVWACPDPNCPVKTHISIRTPQEEA